MKFLIFSDLHIHNYKQHNNEGDRLANCLRALETMCDFAVQNGMNILFAGDLFDTQKALLTEVVNDTLAKFIDIFVKYPELKLYAITGNHDQNAKNLLDKPADSALRHLSLVFPDNFILVDNKVIPLSDSIILAGIPYYEYKEHFNIRLAEIASEVAAAKAGLEEEGKSPKAYLMIHQTAKITGNDIIPYETDPTDDYYKIFDHVYCGHIHTRGELTHNFTNVGNPMHRDLADAGKEKGFYIRNLEKPEKGHRFIYLKGFPEFVVKTEGEEISAEEANNFVVVQPDFHALSVSEEANVEEFNTSLESAQLMENYWKNVDGKDKLLLSVGLELLK